MLKVPILDEGLCYETDNRPSLYAWIDHLSNLLFSYRSPT